MFEYVYHLFKVIEWQYNCPCIKIYLRFTVDIMALE